MSEHHATVRWTFKGPDFKKGQFSREHSWSFDGGTVVAASASPSVVPPPFADAAAVDPEEAFVASLSSCHMLTFLHLASRRGFEVASYEDHAVGTMVKNERGVPWVASVLLDPHITFSGTPPAPAELLALHEKAHEHCFIANSVKTDVRVKGLA